MSQEPASPPRSQRRGHGRVTLREVAELAGVTAITVSRYLREPDRVAGETAQRIAQALRRTGYVPNRQAGLLASGRSRIVAALIPSIANSIFAETVQGLNDTLQPAGFELLLASSGYSMEREEEQARVLLGWAPAALVLTGRHHTRGMRSLILRARAAGTPVVEMWDLQPRRGPQGVAQVGFDHQQVGRAMAEHLLARGHRRLAYVDSSVAEDYRAHERGAGFAAAAEAGGAAVQMRVAPAGDPVEAGRQVFAQMQAEGTGAPDAAAFTNDHLACGALLEAQQLGVPVPGRLAVLGFGDFAIGRHLQPPLSTVRPPRYEIGSETARLILAMLESSGPGDDRALPWTLIARGST